MALRKVGNHRAVLALFVLGACHSSNPSGTEQVAVDVQPSSLPVPGDPVLLEADADPVGKPLPLLPVRGGGTRDLRFGELEALSDRFADVGRGAELVGFPSPGVATRSLDLSPFRGKVLVLTFLTFECCSWSGASAELGDVVGRFAGQDLVRIDIAREGIAELPDDAVLDPSSTRALLVSDVDHRCERLLCPDAFQGFRSGSPRHLLVDRQGVLRDSDVSRPELAARIAALLAEPMPPR